MLKVNRLMIVIFLLLVISVTLGVVGQINLKQGMILVNQKIEHTTKITENQKVKDYAVEKIKKGLYLIFTAFLNYKVIIGIFCYAVSMVFWLLILSKAPLSLAYPMLGTSYILVVLSSQFILHEAVSPIRWLGTLIISLGVILVARS